MIVNFDKKYVIFTPPKTGGGGLAAAGLGVAFPGMTRERINSPVRMSYSNNLIDTDLFAFWFGSRWKNEVTLYITVAEPLARFSAIYRMLARDRTIKRFIMDFLFEDDLAGQDREFSYLRNSYFAWMQNGSLIPFGSHIRPIHMGKQLQPSLDRYELAYTKLPAQRLWRKEFMDDWCLRTLCHHYRLDAMRFGFGYILEELERGNIRPDTEPA